MFFTKAVIELDEAQTQQLGARNVTIEREIVTEIADERAAVSLQDGRVVELSGLFVASRIEAATSLTDDLGCEFVDTPLGMIIRTDEMKATTVPGVYACGDSTRAAGNVTFAIADGAMAGLAAHRSLIFGLTDERAAA